MPTPQQLKAEIPIDPNDLKATLTEVLEEILHRNEFNWELISYTISLVKNQEKVTLNFK